MSMSDTIKSITLLALWPLLAIGCNTAQTNKAPQVSAPPVSSVSPTLRPTETITIGGHTLHVQVARTAAEQAQGLSGIASLAEDEGMLFSFDPPATPSFWMKDMLFPIDIIWISDGRVIGSAQNLLPPSTLDTIEALPQYLPPSNIDYALEVGAGWIKESSVGKKVLIEDMR